jgi:acyl-CoA synthetase (AMP-forming)/AMP-acid ligase II
MHLAGSVGINPLGKSSMSATSTDGTVFDADQAGDFMTRCVMAAGNDDPVAIGELADDLRALPAAPGSVCLIALSNSVRLLRAFFAVSLAGYVPLLLSPSTPPDRVQDLARRFGAAVFIGNPGKAGVLSGYPARQAHSVRGTAVVVLTGHETIRHAPNQVILLTSGTSGMATGCLHDLSALLANARMHAESVGLRPADTVLATLPMYYSFALVAQVLACLQTGTSLVVAGPPFSADSYLDSVDRHRVTFSSLTPLLVDRLLAEGSHLPAPLRALSVGGQALSAAHVTALRERNPALELFLTYGLTEAGPRVSTLAAHREAPHRYASAGQPVRGVRLALRDAGRGALEQEVLVTSPTVYRKRVGAEVGQEAKRGSLLEPQTLATGDLGYIEDGYLYLRGRTSDFAVVRGEKVFLPSVRATAEALPGVVRAVARFDPSQDAITLELAVHEPTLTESRIRQSLNSLLTPPERPATVLVRQVAAGSLHK